MPRWKKGDESWREDYRRVSRTVSLPSYLVKNLDAQGKVSPILAEILENHKDKIGDGVYKDLIERKRERIALIVEEILKEKLVDNLRCLVQEAVDKYIAEYDTPKQVKK